MSDKHCPPTFVADGDGSPTSSNSIDRSRQADSDIETVSRHGKNKMIACPVCSKTMRSDNMKRHQKVHGDVEAREMDELGVRPTQEDSTINAEMMSTPSLNETSFSCSVCKRGGFNDRVHCYDHERKCTEDVTMAYHLTSPWGKRFKRNVLECCYEYRRKVLMGRIVSSVLDDGEVPERALPQEYIDARDLWLAERDRSDGTCFRLFS